MEIEPPIKTKHTRTTGHHALFHCSIATKPQIIARLPVVIHSAVASGIVSWCVEFRRVTILQLGCSSTKGLWADRNGSFERPNDINLRSSRTISKSHANLIQSPYVIRKYRINYQKMDTWGFDFGNPLGIQTALQSLHIPSLAENCILQAGHGHCNEDHPSKGIDQYTPCICAPVKV